MKLIKLFLEILGWLQIVLGPTIIAAMIAFIIYINWPSKISNVIAILILLAGFIFGAILATRIWKKHGTIEWLSSIRRIN
jgi:hypothetical protein